MSFLTEQFRHVCTEKRSTLLSYITTVFLCIGEYLTDLIVQFVDESELWLLEGSTEDDDVMLLTLVAQTSSVGLSKSTSNMSISISLSCRYRCEIMCTYSAHPT